MVATSIKTPGVYVTEMDAFPPSIIGVETAVPAFIGYTEQANIQGKPVYLKPVKITSLREFTEIFGRGFKAAVVIKSVDTKTVRSQPDCYDVSINDANGNTLYYSIGLKDEKRFNLFASMKLFFDNGGGTCYVVSVGDYTDDGAEPGGAGISPDKLKQGLAEIAEVKGPTMLAVPDAVLLKPDDAAKPWACEAYYAFVKQMIAQCGALQDRFALLDVYGTQALDQSDPAVFEKSLAATIAEFRDGIGQDDLSYAASYFPFLKTTTYPVSGIDYTWFDPSALSEVLGLQAANLYRGANLTAVQKMIAEIDPDTGPTGAEDIARLNESLRNALPVLKEMEDQAARDLGILPPSGAVAGGYTQVDTTGGVWTAPANVALTSVIAPTVTINNEMQENLNMPLDGKAVDAIRMFPGRGTLVWGARTLLGNSQDWRYIQVRRTAIYIEQSIKQGLMPFVFAANDGKTWSTVVSAVSSFLQQVWAQGGLMGATASEAYSVECGLGSTMTAQDILDGYMIVQVRLQLVRPAEFIVLTFKQKMEAA
ncbi:phage tail sheath family protein [Roseibium sediminicola]|uniref:Tail sheath protein C-terminal domain-containing protein n=1 Tax=Roseibium sediminicola TaxID=2933272 RepID=A0ABT0H056_9HYPH|nr:phage tail sheath C-terminal domain-containing protein [Roseibium sp. CAU 1639]MCK7615078.1 hypothetical protein [Roseibium sp. CAU 1639]